MRAPESVSFAHTTPLFIFGGVTAYSLDMAEYYWLDQLMQLYDAHNMSTAVLRAGGLVEEATITYISETLSYHVQQPPPDKWLLFIQWMYHKHRADISGWTIPTDWLNNPSPPDLRICDLIEKAPTDDVEDISRVSWAQWFNESADADTRVVRVCDAEPCHFMTASHFQKAGTNMCFRCRGNQTLRNHSMWRVISDDC